MFWDRVVDHRNKLDQDRVLTITRAFGAPPYRILLPGTNKPIADQWLVNVFMMELLRARYKSSNGDR